MTNTTKLQQRELSIEEIAYVSGGDDDEIEEIVVTAPRLEDGPSFSDFLSAVPTITLSGQAAIDLGFGSGGTSTTITVKDTNRNGKAGDDDPFNDYLKWLSDNNLKRP